MRLFRFVTEDRRKHPIKDADRARDAPQCTELALFLRVWLIIMK